MQARVVLTAVCEPACLLARLLACMPGNCRRVELPSSSSLCPCSCVLCILCFCQSLTCPCHALPASHAAALPRQLHRCLLRCPSERRCCHCQRLPRAVSACWSCLLATGLPPTVIATPPPIPDTHPLAPSPLQGPPFCRLASAVRQWRTLHGSSPNVCAAEGGGRA